MLRVESFSFIFRKVMTKLSAIIIFLLLIGFSSASASDIEEFTLMNDPCLLDEEFPIQTHSSHIVSQFLNARTRNVMCFIRQHFSDHPADLPQQLERFSSLDQELLRKYPVGAEVDAVLIRISAIFNVLDRFPVLDPWRFELHDPDLFRSIQSIAHSVIEIATDLNRFLRDSQNGNDAWINVKFLLETLEGTIEETERNARGQKGNRLLERIQSELSASLAVDVVDRLIFLVQKASSIRSFSFTLLDAIVDACIKLLINPESVQSHRIGLLSFFNLLVSQRSRLSLLDFTEPPNRFSDTFVVNLAFDFLRLGRINLIKLYPQLLTDWSIDRFLAVRKIMAAFVFFGEEEWTDSKFSHCKFWNVQDRLDTAVVVLSRMVLERQRALRYGLSEEIAWWVTPGVFVRDVLNVHYPVFARWIEHHLVPPANPFFSTTRQGPSITSTIAPIDDVSNLIREFFEPPSRLQNISKSVRLMYRQLFDEVISRDSDEWRILLENAVALVALVLRAEVQWGIINQACPLRSSIESAVIDWSHIVDSIVRNSPAGDHIASARDIQNRIMTALRPRNLSNIAQKIDEFNSIASSLDILRNAILRENGF